MAKLANKKPKPPNKKPKPPNKKPKPPNKKPKPPNMKRCKTNPMKVSLHENLQTVRSAIVTRAVTRQLLANQASKPFVTNSPKQPRPGNKNKKVQKCHPQQRGKEIARAAKVGTPSEETPTWRKMKQLFRSTFNATQAVKKKAIRPAKKAKKPAYGRNGKTNKAKPDLLPAVQSSCVCDEKNKYKRSQPKTQGKRKGITKTKADPCVGNHAKKHMPKNARKKVGNTAKVLRQKKGAKKKVQKKKTKPVPALKKNKKPIRGKKGQKVKAKNKKAKKLIKGAGTKNNPTKNLPKNARKKMGNAAKALRQKKRPNKKVQKPIPVLMMTCPLQPLPKKGKRAAACDLSPVPRKRKRN